MFKKNKGEEKREYIVVAIILSISIIVGIVVGSNEKLFRPAFFSAGFMAGSILTVLGLFTMYFIVTGLMETFSKKK